jgi:hypothetical protein
VTDWLAEGIIIEGNCQTVANSVTYGEIVLRNISVQGNRFASISRPFIDIQTVNNITLDNVILKSYLITTESATASISIKTYPTCIVSAYDGRSKNISISNIHYTSDMFYTGVCY